MTRIWTFCFSVDPTKAPVPNDKSPAPFAQRLARPNATGGSNRVEPPLYAQSCVEGISTFGALTAPSAITAIVIWGSYDSGLTIYLMTIHVDINTTASESGVIPVSLGLMRLY